MRLAGSTGQSGFEYLFDASGTIAAGGTPQLILPQARRRSSLIINNISSSNMYFEFGAARATAVLTSGAISSISVTNSGFGYTVAPVVEFLGGGYDNQSQTTPTFSLTGLPDYTSPRNPAGSPAKAHCIMTGAAGSMSISSIVIDNPGSGYSYPPYVFIRNSPNDPFGAANPFQGSAASGILLLANGGSYTGNGTVTTTDQVSVYCATSAAAYTVKWSL